MICNDVLRSLRYTLNVSESKLIEILALSDTKNVPNISTMASYLKTEDDADFTPCPDTVLADFLDGLVIFKRGPSPHGKPANDSKKINNNVVLKKIRIAFEFKEEDLFDLFDMAGLRVSKPELSALFRAEGQKNFRACGDQFLRNFLKGLALKIRGE